MRLTPVPPCSRLSLQSNIGLVLHGVMEYDLSLRFLENALTINTKYHGPRSLKVALRWGETHDPYA